MQNAIRITRTAIVWVNLLMTLVTLYQLDRPKLWLRLNFRRYLCRQRYKRFFEVVEKQVQYYRCEGSRNNSVL